MFEFDVVITTILFMLVIVGNVGNSLVCYIITKHRDMRYVGTEIEVDKI